MALSRGTESEGFGRGLEIVANSTALKVALFGVLLWVLAVILSTGVWPAIMAIWGTALIVVGVGLYSLVWWFHQ
ncbi:hypothetical protein [Saliphagus infecundisoli]|uniref:Uncharacterized protein n=1 Tax=Saliphagus infecundisoli TaxID=1849069 RepID=A0ABD5QK87_9EURY|nr:hypothetical protein [Saliphagus infecundisoli]